MKLSSLFFILLTSSISFGQLKNPEMPMEGKKIKDLVPWDCVIVGIDFGDLNFDTINDLVLVVQGTDEEGLKNGINSNPRTLGIYFGNNKGVYHKVVQDNNFIPIKDMTGIADPFSDVTISNNILEFNFQTFVYSGGWDIYSSKYKFRYQNNQFSLIGYDSFSFNRRDGHEHSVSINFLTNQVKTTTNEGETKEDEVIIWKTLSSKTKETFKSIGNPLSKSFEFTQKE